MNQVKEFYKTYSDKIFDKRFNSPYPLRRFVHREEYNSILKHIKPKEEILDVGCGEGIISILAAEKGVAVTSCDISRSNIKNAKRIAREAGIERKIKFLIADAEGLPFEDNSFDVVICSHVLEHLPNFNKGLSEIKRVTKRRAIIALPTCLNLCALSVLGGAGFWHIRKKVLLAFPIGILRFIFNIYRKGINEGYAGKRELPHLWRYPWVMKRELQEAGFRILHFEASSICLPYFNFFLPLIKFLDRFKGKPILRNFGYGSIAVVEKSDFSNQKTKNDLIKADKLNVFS